MSQLQDIISDIENESCVLIIGPDLVDFGEKSFFEVLCEGLQNNQEYNNLIDLNPQYIFQHEELLQLKPGAKESHLERYIERFYENQAQYNKPFEQISRIPFHLIVSLLPDIRLKNIFEEQKLDFQYSYYPCELPPKPVSEPTREKPLLYNLLGDISKNDFVITFDHLFTYLTGIMGERSLPLELDKALKEARTCIFLGVHFEKWYVQLILRIIRSKKNRERYTLLRNQQKNELCSFIARRLELDFINSDPQTFLTELYEEMGRRHLLKTPQKTPSYRARVFISYNHQDKNTAIKIEEHLRANNIDVVIDDKSMPGGQKIESFIETIRDVDIVLVIISEHSLRSAWVSKEIITTLEKTDKYLLPCYLDDTFMDKDFVQVANKMVDEKLKKIDDQIVQRGRSHTDDLFSERRDWTDYASNLPIILNELNRRKCVPFPGKDGLQAILEDILKIK